MPYFEVPSLRPWSNITKYTNCDFVSRNITDPVLKAIAKYCNYLSLKAIEKIPKLKDLFSFSNEAFQELSKNKA